jgi:tRNA(fMet)-specific endonuclease VapC
VYLLDANVLGNLSRNPQGSIASELKKREDEKIVTSIIVRCEIEYGLELKKSEKLSRAMEFILSEIEVLDFTAPAHQHYGAIRSALKMAGTPIGPNDLFIAAHAIALDATLVTDNVKEFSRVPGLKIQNWLR